MIKFGAWSITLLIGSAHGLAMAVLLWRAHANRAANRWLAALLAIVVLMITPYTIGYAGFYDAWPWLTFAPFFWQLGIGPLIWLYVRQLGAVDRPPGWGWHFVPMAVEASYYAVLFCLPLEAKWRWNDTAHVPFVAPVERLLILASIAGYLVAAARRYRRYQAWLVDHSAAREEFRLAWVRGFLLATALATLAALGFGVAHLVLRPLSYFDEFPLYLVFTALAWYLGVEGWRHADGRYPLIDAPASMRTSGDADGADYATSVVAPTPAAGQPPAASHDFAADGTAAAAAAAVRDTDMAAQTVESADAGTLADAADPATGESTVPHPGPAAPERDWTALGERVRRQVADGAWWREPELELADLARRVGTNNNYLSRALNDGLGMSFSEFINRQRVEAAQQRLRGHGDVLEIAFDVGFRSKASFNRAFKAYTGLSPSAWRAGGTSSASDADPAPRLES